MVIIAFTPKVDLKVGWKVMQRSIDKNNKQTKTERKCYLPLYRPTVDTKPLQNSAIFRAV